MIFRQSITICCQERLLIEKQIRSLVDFFDRIIIVEGASRGDGLGHGDGRNITGGNISSTDGTVDILKRLQDEIPKLRVVFPPARGWGGKTEQINAGLQHAEPGWLYQRDADEFFFLEDLERLHAVIDDSDYTDVSFFARHFWGSARFHMKISRQTWGNELEWRRVWRWNGEPFLSHEPPRLKRDYENLLTMEETRALGIYLFHYAYAFLEQIKVKQQFYSCDLLTTIEQWRLNPSSVPKNNDLTEYLGPHPVDLPVVE